MLFYLLLLWLKPGNRPVVSCLSNAASARFAVLFGCQHQLRRFTVAGDDSYNTQEYSHGREGDQQCNTDAQTMVVPDIAPPQFLFVHTWRPRILAGGQTLDPAGLQRETSTEAFTPTPQATIADFWMQTRKLPSTCFASKTNFVSHEEFLKQQPSAKYLWLQNAFVRVSLTFRSRLFTQVITLTLHNFNIKSYYWWTRF